MSTTQATRLLVTIPMQMRGLQKDDRGYPIPYVVLRDIQRKPMFTINDHFRTRECLTKHLCSICGKRLPIEPWFVGGSRCFLHEHGAFIDPPVHYECGNYALQVCPFLAMPSYSKRIYDKLLRPERRPSNLTIVRQAHMLPNQPEHFGFGRTADFTYIEYREEGRNIGGIYKATTWSFVEFWRNGEIINAPDKPTGPAERSWVTR